MPETKVVSKPRAVAPLESNVAKGELVEGADFALAIRRKKGDSNIELFLQKNSMWVSFDNVTFPDGMEVKGLPMVHRVPGVLTIPIINGTHIIMSWQWRPNLAADAQKMQELYGKMTPLEGDPEVKITITPQPKIPEDGWQWELPAGGVKEGENLFEAALREARGEVGAKVLELIGPIDVQATHPGWMEEVIPVFLARCKAELTEQQLDATERIKAKILPISSVKKLLRGEPITVGGKQYGSWVDPKSIAALAVAFERYPHLFVPE